MHILLALLAAAAAIGVIIWRIRMASDAAKGVVEAASDAHSFWRRLMWRRKHDRDVLAELNDPREAAAAMMVAVAEYDGSLTKDEVALILDEMGTQFEVAPKDAEELLARGRWHARSVSDLGQFLKRASPAILRHCTHDERRDLITMLRLAAGAGTDGTSVPHHVITRLEEQLLRQVVRPN